MRPYTPAATSRGWVALAGALPLLPLLKSLQATEVGMHRCNTGMGPEGAAALAVALPLCPVLWFLTVTSPFEQKVRTEPGFVALYKAEWQIDERRFVAARQSDEAEALI